MTGGGLLSTCMAHGVVGVTGVDELVVVPSVEAEVSLEGVLRGVRQERADKILAQQGVINLKIPAFRQLTLCPSLGKVCKSKSKTC